MPKFSANLSTLFTELPFRSRFTAARMAGFDAIEFQFPYDHPPEALQSEIGMQGLKMVMFNAPPGDLEAGERGIAALPGREMQFESSIAAALQYADMLNCHMIHVMAGVMTPGMNPDRALTTYLANLRQAAHEAEKQNVTLLIEPINLRDMPGYFLTDIPMAARIIEQIGAPNLRLQFDIYHRQMTDGDVVRALHSYLPITSHIQIANTPNRTEPSIGELNYGYIFRTLDECAYDGWVGCEYTPSAGTKDSLEWFRQLKKQ